MKKVILDCDPGMDDSVAIIMASKSLQLDLLAITCVNGNYPVDITSKNARAIMELLGRDDIIVARGMANPMIRKSPADPFTHGEDGLANSNLPEPKLPLSDKHAVEVLKDLIMENPNEITIIATGPLSNIGMLISQYPETKSLIKEIIAISGTFGLNKAAFSNATGDTPQSEWNVYVDPEASKLVYESKIPFTAIGLDVATNFDVDLTNEDIKQIEHSTNKEAKFLFNAINFVRKRGFGAYCAVIDCMAVAYAINKDLIKCEKVHVGVETKDGLTLGMTVRDSRHHFVWETLPLINIAVDADYQGFLELLKDLVLR